jgi:hypothetical protein
VDLDTVEAVDAGQRSRDVGSDLVLQRAGGRRQRQPHADQGSVQLDLGHHAQVGDRGAELGVHDRAQRRSDPVQRGRCWIPCRHAVHTVAPS